MRTHRTTVAIREDHQVVVRLPDDFPEGKAKAIVLPRLAAISPNEAAVEFARLLVSLPMAPVIARSSLDRAELNR